jgi:hypothetical protein
MNIQPIIEGHGEMEGAPVLLRRLIAEAGVHEIAVNRPIRAHQSELLKEESLRKKVALARKQENCGSIIVLFENEDDCPKTLGPRLLAWAREEATPTPCAVALAHREYEAWFLASVESLRGRRGILPDAVSHEQPESVRDAKGEVEARMQPGSSYSPTVDQPALSQLFDMQVAYGRSRSFRHLAKVFGELVAAMGVSLAVWPPPGWRTADETNGPLA